MCVVLGTGSVGCYCYFLGCITDTKTDCEIFHLVMGIWNCKKEREEFISKECAAVSSRPCCLTLKETQWKQSDSQEGRNLLQREQCWKLSFNFQNLFYPVREFKQGKNVFWLIGIKIQKSQKYQRMVQIEKPTINWWKKESMAKWKMEGKKRTKDWKM